MNAHSYLLEKKKALERGANRFYLADGITADNVLAAYQFKGVSSEQFALQDLSGHGYHLTKGSGKQGGNTYTPTWNIDTGFTFAAVYGGNCGYLDNSSLNSQLIKAVVVRYADMTQNNRGYLVTAGGSDGYCQLMAACSIWEFDYRDEDHDDGSPGAGDVYHVVNKKGVGFVWYNSRWRYTTTFYASAIIGANVGTSGKAYINGTGVNTSESKSAWTNMSSKRTFGNSHAPASDLNNAVHAGKKIICASFYNVALTDAQHKQIADAMAVI